MPSDYAKPFDLKEILRVFKSGHAKAQMRMRDFLREDKYLLPDMMDDNHDTYDGLGIGGAMSYNSKCADFIDSDTRFTFQHGLKHGVFNIRMYLNQVGLEQAEELGLNKDEIQEQINRNVDVITAAIEDAKPYTALRRHWRQGFTRGTSVLITERNPDEYGNFDVSVVPLRNVVIGGRMKLPKEYKSRTPPVFVKLTGEAATADGLISLYGEDELVFPASISSNTGKEIDNLYMGYLSLDKKQRGHFNKKGKRLKEPDADKGYEYSRDEMESETWLVIFTANDEGSGADEFIMCQKAPHMMVTVGTINKDKGEIYGKGMAKKLLPVAERLDQMTHDHSQGVRQNAFPIYTGVGESLVSRNVRFEPNAFIETKGGFPPPSRLDNTSDVRGLALEILEIERSVDAMGSRAFDLDTIPTNQTATAIIVLENSTIGTINDNVRAVGQGFLIPWLRDFIRVLQAEGKVDKYLGDANKKSRMLFDFAGNSGLGITLQTDAELAIKVAFLNRLQIYNGVVQQLVAGGQITPEDAKRVVDAITMLTDLTGKDFLDFNDRWRNTEAEQDELIAAEQAALDQENARLDAAQGATSAPNPLSVGDPNL